MFDELIKRKTPNPAKLLSYGFTTNGDCFQYSTEVCGGTFLLTLQIDENGNFDTELIETESGEVYVLYKTGAAGSFVGEIRTTIEQVVSDIVQECYEPRIFKTEQAQMIIGFVRETYGDELEFLWTKFPDNAVWRRKDNKKWYSAVLTVSGKKIGLKSDKMEEIIDLRMSAEDAETVLARAHYYPGWHMNKKSWYTLVLDGSIADDELKQRVRESFDLAGK